MPLIAAGIGAGASVLGGLMGGKGAKKATKKAIKSQEKIAAANNALIQWNYNQNAARLDPFVSGGTRAGNVLMELLLGPAPAGSGGSAAGSPIGGSTGGTYSGGPSAQEQLDFLLHGSQNTIGPDRTAAIMHMSGTPEEKLAYAVGVLHDEERNYYNQYMTAHPQTYTPAPAAPTGATSNATGQPTSALSAWDQFRNGTNYNWRLGQGAETVQQGFAGQSTDSGAEKIALLEYNQNFASNELGNWMNLLAGQQGIGLQAGSALAGVGTNATNNMVANNQNLADAHSNAALTAGQANQQMWGSIGQGIGQAAGALASSYNSPAPPGGGGYIPGGGMYPDIPDYLVS